jgi:phage terminase large subunit GpA-like protein
VLAHYVIWGSPDDDSLWWELDELLKTRWPHPLGGRIGVDACAIDSGDGDWTQRVYDFAFPRARRRVMAIKGQAGARPVIAASKSKIKGTGMPGRLWIVGSDTIKTTLFNRLQRGRSIRFSDSLEPIYYEQLASERKIVRYVRGRPVRRFERISGNPRAEAPDCLCYAFAARSAVPTNLECARRS